MVMVQHRMRANCVVELGILLARVDVELTVQGLQLLAQTITYVEFKVPMFLSC